LLIPHLRTSSRVQGAPKSPAAIESVKTPNARKPLSAFVTAG
jgi:hypothetical protein